MGIELRVIETGEAICRASLSSPTTDSEELAALGAGMRQAYNVSPSIVEDIWAYQCMGEKIREAMGKKADVRRRFGIKIDDRELQEEVISEGFPEYRALGAKEYEFEEKDLPGGKVVRKVSDFSIVEEVGDFGEE